MNERVVMVTGAARGIGKGVAVALARPGVTVHVSDRESQDQRHISLPGTVEDTAREISDRGCTGIAHIVDHVCDDDAVAAMFTDIEHGSTGLNVLVANAFNGNALPFAPAPFWELPWEHWHNMIDPDQASFTGRTITVDARAAHYGIDDEPATEGMSIS